MLSNGPKSLQVGGKAPLKFLELGMDERDQSVSCVVVVPASSGKRLLASPLLLLVPESPQRYKVTTISWIFVDLILHAFCGFSIPNLLFSMTTIVL